MPYLTNNQRMDLGLEGACCVKEETLERRSQRVITSREQRKSLLNLRRRRRLRSEGTLGTATAGTAR